MIEHHTTFVLWLHLEHYYNRGLAPERARELIEQLSDPSSGRRLRCSPMHTNSNWRVGTGAPERWHAMIVAAIEETLDAEMERAVLAPRTDRLKP